MREFKLAGKIVISLLVIGLVAFQLYAAAVVAPTGARPIHVGILLILYLLLYAPFKSKKGKSAFFLLLDIAFAVFVAAITVRMYLYYNAPKMQEHILLSTRDWVFGIGLIVAVLEVTRRSFGWTLVSVVLIFLVYDFLGPYAPGPLAHEGILPRVFVGENLFGDVGVYGPVTGLSVNFIFLLVVFASLLLHSGAGDFLIQLAIALAGRFRGGPAKVAVIGSAMFSTISGSTAANVVATGTFTIPMMKKLGFAPEYAGAVEAVASNGGTITPPVMGAVAFLIAEFLRISYAQVALAATIPAVLYFASALFGVDFHAARTGLQGLSRQNIPPARSVLKGGWYFLVPVAVLVYLLFVPMWSVQRACLWAIAAVAVIEVARQIIRNGRVDFKKLYDGLVYAGKSYLGIAAALFVIGIIMLSIDVTGLAIKITSLLVSWSGGRLLPMLVLTAIASLILGTGLPAVACYIFVVMLAVPALLKAGVTPLAAHMFAFHFGNISHLTPPVCITAYVAGSLANANGLRVGLASIRLATAGWIIPFLFVYRPALLLDGSPLEIVAATATGLVGVYAMAAGMQGYMFGTLARPVRAAALAAGILLLFPTGATDLVGFAVMGVVVLYGLARAKRLGPHRTPANTGHGSP